jgi:hypothetical protein
MFVEVVRLAVYKSYISTRNASDWPGEAIIDSHLQPSHVEIVEVAIESSVAIGGFEISVVLGSESLSKEISDVTEYDENDGADRGGQKGVLGWCAHNGLWKLSPHVFADISMALMTERSELCVYSCLSFGFCD